MCIAGCYTDRLILTSVLSLKKQINQPGAYDDIRRASTAIEFALQMSWFRGRFLLHAARCVCSAAKQRCGAVAAMAAASTLLTYSGGLSLMPTLHAFQLTEGDEQKYHIHTDHKLTKRLDSNS